MSTKIKVTVEMLWRIRDEGISAGRSESLALVADELEDIANGKIVVSDHQKWLRAFVERLRDGRDFDHTRKRR